VGDLAVYLISSNLDSGFSPYGFTSQASSAKGVTGDEPGAASVAGGATWSADCSAVAIVASLIPGPQGQVNWFFLRQQKFLRNLRDGLIPRELLRRRFQEVYAI
jgi:hypothetical protein